ncbi:lysophospholipase L1-like esterase [Breznakibacter xylanolyticus]|uniref:Lysophospholipase L1-like esterase n=1 Tax=Breznakibacter xylanolyticus TaxID=990 RepID=A0A2W7NFC7_9BACT|nr:rhamnogalacturonan acetylesterase [Breznakibacter xylanolyticus]PZX18620.1 lysophospholipase L1-like esterase [Breznakibacter xylanolyticus]
MRKIIGLLAISALITTGFICKKEKQVRILMSGDSTMQTYRDTLNPQRGWGQVLPDFFDEQTHIINMAIGGRSTKTFQTEGRWQKLLDTLQAGDWVIIQFGHNDATVAKPERYCTPDAYKQNLIKFVNDVRSKKGNPILCTSIVMHRFHDNGTLKDGHGEYPGKMREVANELKVPLIDLHHKTRQLLEQMGPEASKSLYMIYAAGQHPSLPDGKDDHTHINETGAREVARLATEGMRELKLKGLTKRLRR